MANSRCRFDSLRGQILQHRGFLCIIRVRILGPAAAPGLRLSPSSAAVVPRAFCDAGVCSDSGSSGSGKQGIGGEVSLWMRWESAVGAEMLCVVLSVAASLVSSCISSVHPSSSSNRRSPRSEENSETIQGFRICTVGPLSPPPPLYTAGEPWPSKDVRAETPVPKGQAKML